MQRREFIGLVGGTAAAWPLAAHAQQARRIGVLMGASQTDPETQRRIEAFVQKLIEFGWAEGRNVRFDYRFSPEVERMGAYAAEIVELRPDLIVVHSNPFLAALRRVNRTIPTVFIQVADPVGSGFVDSLARPGGNLTGFTVFEAEIGGKWLQFIKEIAPGVTRALALLQQEIAANVAFLRAAEAAARSLQINLTAAGVHNTAEIEQAIVTFAQEPGGGLIVLPSPVIGPNVDRIAALAARHRLPCIFPFRFWMAMNGGLMSYSVDAVDLFQKGAAYVDRILRGAKPSDLPVQNPIKYELVINLKTAKALGLTVPPTLIVSADELIE